MNITPTNGHLLIEVETLKEVTSASGIIVSAETNVAVERGKVIRSGDTEYEPGRIVYYKDYDLSKIKVEDKEFNFLRAESVLGYE